MSEHATKRSPATLGAWIRRVTGDRAKALLSLGVVLGLGAVGTMAAWTDDASSTATFSTGSIDLQLTNEVDDDYSFTALNLADMAPGDSTAAVLPVQNTGTLPFTFTLAGAATNVDGKGLGAAMGLVVKTGATLSGTGRSKTCAGGTSVLGRTGLAGTAAAIPGTVAPAGATNLCFQVTLPASAATTLQGAATTATFTFQATNG